MADTTRTPNSTPANEPLAFDDRTRRVMELRKRIREGAYNPNPREVAEALLRHWAVNADVLPGDSPAPSLGTTCERQEVGTRFFVERTAPVATAQEVMTA